LPHATTQTPHHHYHGNQTPHLAHYPLLFFNAVSQSYRSLNKGNPHHQVPDVAEASYHGSDSNGPSSRSSSVSSYQISDQSPPNRTLAFFQSQLDELKRVSLQTEIEKQQILKALEDATAKLNGTHKQLRQQHDFIQTLENRLRPAPPKSTPEPTPNTVPLDTNQNAAQSSHTIADLLKLSPEHQQSTKFPKFHGKSKKEFKSWYDQVLAILACPPWTSVFSDMETKKLKIDQISSNVSAKLFASL